MRFFATIAIVILLASCTGPADVTPGKKADETQKDAGYPKDATYQKEMDELRKSIKSEVKIKLKKDGKGSYSWEIQGKDPQEVLRVNETLRKKLGD
jgi:basic membrane lipoprotein Med (substrate-binding protein (PBP1-ABC) superfamily)